MAAIVVAIAVLDNNSRAMVTDYSKLTGNSVFADAKDPANDTTYHGDIASAWNAAILSNGFAANAKIPKAAASAVRVYQRYFYLDSPQ